MVLDCFQAVLRHGNLPTSTKSVDSSSLDISLLRYLIQTFCHIKNAHGKWDEPVPCDKTICAYVYRAANIRNTIFHYSNIEKLDVAKFEEIWEKMKIILTGLKYFEDIEAIKAIEPLDPTKLQGEILQGTCLVSRCLGLFWDFRDFSRFLRFFEIFGIFREF